MADKCTRWWFNNKKERVNQRRKEEAKSFSWFFSQREIFFPVENFHFGRPKTSFSGFEKWKEKEKRKIFSSFSSFHFIFKLFLSSIFNFPSSLLWYSFFSSPFSTLFPFFPCLFFPGRSVEISRSELSGGHYAPCPRLLRHWCQTYRERRRLIGNRYEWHRNYLRTSGVEDVEEAELNKEKGHTYNKWFYCSKYRSW